MTVRSSDLDDRPTDHVITLVEDPNRFNRYRPTCTCGWQSSKVEAVCRATAAGERHTSSKRRPPASELTAVQRVRAHELSWLLGAADRHDLWQEADGTSVETCAEHFGLSDPISEVTEEVRIAEAAGLLRPRPLRHGVGAAWELTDAGRAALDLERGITRPQPAQGGTE
jgi:hypothetical protein